MTADEALREILRAVEAWDQDEDFGMDTDAEFNFKCDADFITYVGQVAEAAVAPASPRTQETNKGGPMTHQDALTCAAKLAGGLKPKRTVSLRLAPPNEQHKQPKPIGEVWLDVYGLSLRDLNALEGQIQTIGYVVKYGGGSEFNIVGKVAPGA